MPGNGDTTATQFLSDTLLLHSLGGRTPDSHAVTPTCGVHETEVELPQPYRAPAVRSER